MNVYVRELVASLAQAGVSSDVYTRRSADDLPEVVEVEPGFRVIHVPAGPAGLPKEALGTVLDELADGVRRRLEPDVDALHANYWLSGMVGHQLKHELDLPLVSTFHTLSRVKAEMDASVTGELELWPPGPDGRWQAGPEPGRRVKAEMEVIGCSDAILASCATEARQLEQLYGADPERIEIVPPGVDHAFFSPGSRDGARAALRHLDLGPGPVLLFVGRIQPLKSLHVAVEALAALRDPRAVLVVVGGASGPRGREEVARIHELVACLGLSPRVRFVDPQPHHLLSTYYRAADVVLVPSRSESFGLVALEAAACGTPVVAAAVGGLRTLVDHGRTGFLVAGRDPKVYAAYVQEIVDHPELARSLSQTAARRARDYTWSTTAGRLRRVYADLTARDLVSCA
jgi:D-inositol-3-phosphate glycosyltransferase